MIDTEILEVKAASDHLSRISSCTPLTAIEELIWNSCDADATHIQVTLSVVVEKEAGTVVIELLNLLLLPLVLPLVVVDGVAFFLKELADGSGLAVDFFHQAPIFSLKRVKLRALREMAY